MVLYETSNCNQTLGPADTNECIDVDGSFSILVNTSGACTLCGNGLLDDGEECDDGNTQDGDCCSSTCQSTTCADDNIDCTLDVCSVVDCTDSCLLSLSNCNDLCDGDAGCEASCDAESVNCAAACPCANIPNNTLCEDDNFCTVTERCSPFDGGCESLPRNCSDGVQCTDDACVDESECQDVCIEQRLQCQSDCQSAPGDVEECINTCGAIGVNCTNICIADGCYSMANSANCADDEVCDSGLDCQPDCNGNDIPDVYDIGNATSADANDDGIPDECQLGACCAFIDDDDDNDTDEDIDEEGMITVQAYLEITEDGEYITQKKMKVKRKGTCFEDKLESECLNMTGDWSGPGVPCADVTCVRCKDIEDDQSIPGDEVCVLYNAEILAEDNFNNTPLIVTLVILGVLLVALIIFVVVRRNRGGMAIADNNMQGMTTLHYELSRGNKEF